MPGLPTKIFLYFLRAQFSGWAEGSFIEQRARQEKSARFFWMPKHLRSQIIDVDGVSSEWIENPDSDAGIILYLHGGAYTLGSANTHRDLIARLVVSTQCNALAINYRLAPENSFPAALDDTLSAYHWLLQQGIPPANIVIAGDSAGGGLALSTLVSLRDARVPLPSAAVCFSPWLDLTLSGNSIHTKASVDPILTSAILERFAHAYAAGHPLTHPLISPLFADLHGLPPILVQVGSEEILLDDSIRLAQNIRIAGGRVTLQTWDGLFHVFQMFSFIPETPRALEKVALFLAALSKGNQQR